MRLGLSACDLSGLGFDTTARLLSLGFQVRQVISSSFATRDLEGLGFAKKYLRLGFQVCQLMPSFVRVWGVFPCTIFRVSGCGNQVHNSWFEVWALPPAIFRIWDLPSNISF